MKTLNLSAAALIAASGLLLTGPAANATPDKETGHAPVTFCHNGQLITTDDDGLNGHKNHEDDVFEWEIGRPVTEADCAAPVDEDPVIGSSKTVSYTCDAVAGNFELTTTIVTRASGQESVTEVSARPLTEEETLEHCGPTPGDLPVAPETPVETPVETPAVPEQPVTPSSPEQPVLPAVPAEQASVTPEQVVATQKPTELAYTGFNWLAFSLGAVALGAGIFLRTKFA